MAHKKQDIISTVSQKTCQYFTR